MWDLDSELRYLPVVRALPDSPLPVCEVGSGPQGLAVWTDREVVGGGSRATTGATPASGARRRRTCGAWRATARTCRSPDASVAAAVAVDTLEHIPRRERAAVVAEMLRVTAPGGRVVLMGPTGPEAAAGDAYLLARHRERGAREGPVVWLGEHAEHGLPTLDELVGLLARGRATRITAAGRLQPAAVARHAPRGARRLPAAPRRPSRPPPRVGALRRRRPAPAPRTATTAGWSWRSSAEPRMAPVSVDTLIVSYGTRDELRDVPALRCLSAPAPGVELRASVLDNGSADGSADMVAREFPVGPARPVPGEPRLRHRQRTASRPRARRLAPAAAQPGHARRGPAGRPAARRAGGRPGDRRGGPPAGVPGRRGPDLERALPDAGLRAGQGAARDRAAAAAAPGLRRRARSWATTGALGSSRRAAAHDADFLWATCWLLRRADVEASGLFDPRFPVYDEDLDLCSRLREHGRRVVYVPDAEVVHLGGASSTTAHKRQLVRAGRGRWYRRHRGALSALAYTAIVRGADAAKAAGARARGAAKG